MSDYTQNKGLQKTQVTIESAAQLSSAADLNGHTFCGFAIPSAMTGDAITFEGSVDDGTSFDPIKATDGTDRSVVIQTSEAGIYTVNPADFAGITHIKLKSDAAEGAGRTLQILGVKAANF